MPRLPGPEALGALPELRSGAAPAQIAKTTDPIAEGVGRIGGALATVGREQEDKEETYEVQRRVLEFNRGEERALEDGRRTMEAGGAGFADTFRTGYDTRAREVFGRARTEGLSHTALQRLDVALLRAGEGLQTRAYRHQRDEEDRFNRYEVTERLNGLIADIAGRPDLIQRLPEYLQQGRLEAEALIDGRGGSRLSAADRHTVRRTFHREFETAVRTALVALAATSPELREEANRLLLGSTLRPAPPPGRRRRPSGSDLEREGEPPPVTAPGPGRQPPPRVEDATTTPPPAAGFADLVTRSRGIIGRMEGSRQGYRTEVESTDRHGRRQVALGQYGIMDFNLAEWSKAALGREVSREDFLNSPDIQDRIFNHRFGILLREENGDVGNAAQRWFAGSLTNRAPDRFGTRGPGYRERFLRHYAEAGGPPPPPTTEGPSPPTAEPPPAAPPPPPPTGLVRPAQGIDLDNIVFVRVGPDGRPDPRGVPTRVRTFVAEIEGRFFVIPRFDERGRPLSVAAAQERLLRTGNHLGEFDTRHDADAHARVLWEGPPRATPPPTGGTGSGWTATVRVEGEPPPTTEPPGDGPPSEGSLWHASRLGQLMATGRQLNLMDRQEAARLDQDITSWVRDAGEGRPPPLDEMVRVARALDNVRDQELKDRYQAVLRYARRTHEIMGMHPSAMERVIRAERERQNNDLQTSSEARRWLASWEKLLEHTNTQRRTNTIEWAARLGIANFSAGLRFDDDDSMRAHAVNVRLVDQTFGPGGVSPRVFTNAMRDHAVGILRQGGQPMLDRLGSMVRNWGPDLARRAIRELATATGAGYQARDVAEIVLLGNMYLNSQGNPALQRTVNELAELIRVRASNPDMRAEYERLRPSADESRAAQEIVGNTFTLNDETRVAAVEAANMLYASRARGRFTTFNQALWRQGFLEIAGQSTERNISYGGIYHQGSRFRNGIVVPSNMRTDSAGTWLYALRLTDLIDEHGFGPQDANGRYFTMRDLRGMTMVYAGNGRYRFSQTDPTAGPETWVRNADGQEFELDVRRLSGTVENPGPLRRRAPELFRGYADTRPFQPRDLRRTDPPTLGGEQPRVTLGPDHPDYPKGEWAPRINPGRELTVAEFNEFQREFNAAYPRAERARIRSIRSLYWEELRTFIDGLPPRPGSPPPAPEGPEPTDEEQPSSGAPPPPPTSGETPPSPPTTALPGETPPPTSTPPPARGVPPPDLEGPEPTEEEQPTVPGMLRFGTIDLTNRPVLRNADGSISTIESITINDGGHEVLIPTIVDGRRVTPEQAIEHYRKTREHLGVFDTPANADAFARELSRRQGQRYGAGPPPAVPDDRRVDTARRGLSIAGIWQSLFGGASPSGPTPSGPTPVAPRIGWPSEEEIRRAQRSGVGYGTRSDTFVSGDVANLYAGTAVHELPREILQRPHITNFLLNPRVHRFITREGLGGQTQFTAEDLERAALMYTAAQIAGNRSALVGLGLDPARFALNVRDRERGLNLAGTYNLSSDVGYAGSLDDVGAGAPGQTLAHEAIHRSIELLRRDPRTRGLLSAVMGRGVAARAEYGVEEHAVRLASWLLAGAPLTETVPITGISGNPEGQARALEAYQNRDLAYYGLRRQAGGDFPIAIASERRLGRLTPAERAMALELIATELVVLRGPARGPR